jgi:proline iminopeptidase
MAGIDKLASIPAVLVHGRHDISSPPGTAWRLHHAWPASRLVVLDDAGHSGSRFGREIVGRRINVVTHRRTGFGGALKCRWPQPAQTAG